MSQRESYEITLERPEGVSVAQMKHYIKEAVDSWKGGMDPMEPLFDLRPCQVRRIAARPGVSRRPSYDVARHEIEVKKRARRLSQAEQTMAFRVAEDTGKKG